MISFMISYTFHFVASQIAGTTLASLPLTLETSLYLGLPKKKTQKVLFVVTLTAYITAFDFANSNSFLELTFMSDIEMVALSFLSMNLKTVFSPSQFPMT